MGKFELYQQFQNRKSGRIAHVTKIDDTCKTIILMYDESHDGDKENGICLSYPTVSKNWKRLETYSHPDIPSVTNEKPAKKEEKKQVTKKQKEEPVKENQEDVASDGTSYAEVMQEILADEKQAVKNVKGKKKERVVNTHVDEILDYVFEVVAHIGGDVGVPRDAEMKFRALRKEGRQFCKLMWSGKSVKLYSKVNLEQCACTKVNYPSLPNMYEFEHCDESSIKAVLIASYDACVAGKKNETKKEEK